MVKQCDICKICNYQPEAQNLSFHRFPANPEKRNLWISLLGFEEGKQYPRIMHVCSRHFRQSDVQSRDDGTRYLMDSALPLPLHSLFDSHENKRVDNVDGCSTEVKVEPICDYDTGAESAQVASASFKFINQMKTEPIEDHDIDLGSIQVQGSVHGISGMKEEPIYETDAGVGSVNTAKPRKTKAEYQKAYRERIKAKKNENKEESTAKPQKTKAEYQKEYRERQKAKKIENKQESTVKPPKTNAEHQKAFRERQKMKKIKNKRERIEEAIQGISEVKEEPVYKYDPGVPSVNVDEAVLDISRVKEEPMYVCDPGVGSVNVGEAVPGIIQVKEEPIYSYDPGVASVKLENITEDVGQVKEEPVYYRDLGIETVNSSKLEGNQVDLEVISKFDLWVKFEDTPKHLVNTVLQMLFLMECVSDNNVNGIKEEPLHNYVTESASSRKRSYAESMSSSDFYMREYKRKIKRIKESIVRRRKRVYTLQKTVRRLQQRVVELESDVSQLLRENSSLPESTIEASLSGSTEVLQRLLNGASTKKFNCPK